MDTHHTLEFYHPDTDTDYTVPNDEWDIESELYEKEENALDVFRAMQDIEIEMVNAFVGFPCRWYDHSIHMRALSERFPEILFTLHGEGEEAGDVWNEYYLGGKCQVAKAEIVIAEFDPAGLK